MVYRSCIPPVIIFFYYRVIFGDLEPTTLGNVRSSAYGRLLQSDNFINVQSGAGSSLEKGYSTEGAELVEQILNAVRKETVLADC